MKTEYICEYCEGGMWGGGFATPELCKAHEPVCEFNPASKSCQTCRYWDWPETKEQQDKWGYEDEDGWQARDGCLVFNDQKHRTKCEKWEPKK